MENLDIRLYKYNHHLPVLLLFSCRFISVACLHSVRIPVPTFHYIQEKTLRRVGELQIISHCSKWPEGSGETMLFFKLFRNYLFIQIQISNQRYKYLLLPSFLHFALHNNPTSFIVTKEIHTAEYTYHLPTSGRVTQKCMILPGIFLSHQSSLIDRSSSSGK